MDDTEAKQNFLREEIIDKGYDADKFSDFLALKKGDEALNLELWSMKELSDVVAEFKIASEKYQQEHDKETHKENIYSEEPNPQDSNANQNQIVQNEGCDGKEPPLPKATTTTTTTSSSIKEEPNINFTSADPFLNLDINYAETIMAKKLKKSDLEKLDKVKIYISSVDKHPGGIFSKAYVTYCLNTDPLNLTVPRRYTDFKWLQNVLQTVFVGSCIPPIPKKNFGNAFEESLVNKRKRSLEKFMQALLTIPIVRNSPMLYDFLSIVEESEFKKAISKYNGLVKPQFSNILSVDGTLDLRVSRETDIKLEQIIVSNNQNEALLNKLSVTCKTLFNEMMQVSYRLNEVSEIFQQLYDYSNNFNDNEALTDIYQAMTTLMKKWSECEKRQAGIIETDLREHFKYNKNELVMMKELYTKVDDANKNFYKQYKWLTLKKDELFRKGEVKTWGLAPEDMKMSGDLLQNRDLALTKMLPKKTAELLVAKKEYGFYTTSFISEFERFRRSHGIRDKENSIHMANSSNEIITNMHQMWADVLTTMLELKV